MKIVLLGDSQVGKSCLVARITRDAFSTSGFPTIGGVCQNFIVQTKKGSVTLNIWDTAGQEQYRALTPMYYRGADVAILCFDLTNSNSFISLEQWAHELQQKSSDALKIVVVGTKADLVEKRSVTSDQAKDFARSHFAAIYKETSSKTGEGVRALFTEIAEIGSTPIPAPQPSVDMADTIPMRPQQKECC